MHLAQRFTRMGDSGAGQTTKLANQVIVGSLDVRGTSDMTVRYVNHVFTPRFELWLVE